MGKIGLLSRLIIGLIFGIMLGYVSKEILHMEFGVRLFATFNTLFGAFLSYVIPLIIIGFVAPGIAELGTSAGRLLAMTTVFAYTSTVFAGSLSFLAGSTFLPSIISAVGGAASNPEDSLLKAFFVVDIPPLMGVMTALVTAFVFGLGMAYIKDKNLFVISKDFQEIIEMIIQKAIIPLLPFHIAGIFANMTYAGEVARIMKVFGMVFILVIICHIIMLLIQYGISGTISGRNPIRSLKTMIPAYLTAIGTQSSAATIPVTLRCSKELGLSHEVADFAIPLCATIHLSGSTITLTMCSMAVMMMSGSFPGFSEMFPFILMLGVTMVAAPGVPGGAVMAALGLLQSMLGFTEAQLGLMIALYLTQDSFGTACNVTGDASIAMLTDKFARTS